MHGITLALLTLTVIFDGNPYNLQMSLYIFSGDQSIQMKVLIISLVYKHWRYFRHTQTQGAVPLSVLLHVIMFTIYHIVVVMYVPSKMISYFQDVNHFLPSSTYGAV
jgi:hypothetical protein